MESKLDTTAPGKLTAMADSAFIAARPATRLRPLRLGVRCPLAGVVVLEIAGEVDLRTAPRLWSVVRRQIESRPRVFVLDLDQVFFMGASGVAVLVTAGEIAPLLGVELRLARPARAVARPLDALRLTAGFDVRGTLAAATAV